MGAPQMDAPNAASLIGGNLLESIIFFLGMKNFVQDNIISM